MQALLYSWTKSLFGSATEEEAWIQVYQFRSYGRVTYCLHAGGRRGPYHVDGA